MRRLRRLAFLALVGALLQPVPALAGRIVTIRGGGWGHGIGMSQYGAQGMAKDGKTALQIVRHYYTGTTLGVETMPPRVRVGLLQYRSAISAKSSNLSTGGKVAFQVGTTTIATGGKNATWEVRPSGTGGMRLYKNGDLVKLDGKSVFGSTTTPLVMVYEPHDSMALVLNTGRRYRHGDLRFGTHKSPSCSPGYCVRLVLSLPMQEYLYGLGEMPSSWHLQALKVQAMAGRTYAFRKINTSGQHRVGCDCALYDSVVDQAYIGDAKRDADGDGKDDTYWPNWRDAVDLTLNQVILYDGKPIQALYSSSSGGHTEDNENVWGGAALPYLRGVPDPADAISPNHRWKVSMSWRTFSSKLNSYYGTGRLKGFRIVEPRGVSGRVSIPRSDGTGGATITGSNRTARVSGWTLRSALGLKDSLFNVEVTWAIGSRFIDKYRALKGAPGKATGNPYWVPKGSKSPAGQAQNFERGRMTWRRATGKVVWQWGKVLKKYDALGREASALRMPTSDIWGNGSYYGGSYVRGKILWSSATGAHAVVAGFHRAFQRTGGRTGTLGLPTTAAHRATTLPDRGARQRFEKGSAYRNPHRASRGIFALWGPIDDRYRNIGEASSACGYPTAYMKVDGDRASATFENGVIRLTATGRVRVSCS